MGTVQMYWPPMANSPTLTAKCRTAQPKTKSIGGQAAFNMAPWSDYVEVYWSEHAEAYVTPVAEDLVGVAILYYKDKLQNQRSDRFDSLLTLFQPYILRLEGQSQASSPEEPVHLSDEHPLCH